MGGRNRFSRRLAYVAVACAAVAVTIAAKMVRISIVEGPDYVKQVSDITCGESVKMSYRGAIVDRNGSALATSMAASSVAMRRSEYRFRPQDVEQLAPLIDMDPQQLTAKLRDDSRRFVWLSRKVGVEAANAIERLRIAGIDVHRSQQRAYPQGPLAAHVIGFVGVDAQGLEGVERLYDDRIRGEAVSIGVCKDARGRIFLADEGKAGLNRGASVQLTLDATLQSVAEAELNRQVAETRANGGSVVMIDPRSGEVLAMANAPSFDPNDYQHWPLENRRNRAITDLFEPGSTAKPLLIAAALDAGAIRPSDSFFCENGSMRIGGWVIHDHHPHATLTIPEILEVSSNICAAKVGAQLGAEKFYHYLSEFGLGRRSGIDLPGDRRGVLAPPSRWRPINVANISFGQGVSVSTLQLAGAFATLANGGVRMRPFVVRRILAPDGSVLLANGPREEARVVRSESADEVTRMLEAVVSEEGTAPAAAVPGIRVAGKTGTAQKVENGRYSRTRWIASFVGYLPAEAPKLVIAVVLDEPKTNHYGGIVAAPVFRRIAEASLDYLRIPRQPVVPPRSRLMPPVVFKNLRPPERYWGPFDGVMPDVRGLSLRAAMRAFDGCDCGVRVRGAGYVVEQNPSPGTRLAASEAIALDLAPVARR